MAPRPTVIGTQGYRRGLASLSVVKELLFRVHRNAPVDRLTAVLSNLTALRSRQIKLALGLSGGTYPAALRGLAFQLCLPQLPLSFCFVFSCLRLASEIPCGTSRHSLLITNHCCKIKNPASSAGYSHSYLSGSTRCSTSF